MLFITQMEFLPLMAIILLKYIFLRFIPLQAVASLFSSIKQRDAIKQRESWKP